MSEHNLVLCFRASDKPGIMADVTTELAGRGCDIREADVFGDEDTGQFFVRIAMTSLQSHKLLCDELEAIGRWTELDWHLHDRARKTKVLIAVSKFGHCLVDLVHKAKIGQLPVDIVGVVSNHDDMRKFVEWHGLEFHHLPMTAAKADQEMQFASVIERSGADLVVLARYMQILSNEFAASLAGRCINIHHSFLPSFKGAKPYHQAHRRGVKLIGATAHFVTADLDEGPIIEQDVRRVSHAVPAQEMVELGQEVEASVLSRAVRWYAEHRIFANGSKTVVL